MPSSVPSSRRRRAWLYAGLTAVFFLAAGWSLAKWGGLLNPKSQHGRRPINRVLIWVRPQPYMLNGKVYCTPDRPNEDGSIIFLSPEMQQDLADEYSEEDPLKDSSDPSLVTTTNSSNPTPGPASNPTQAKAVETAHE